MEKIRGEEEVLLTVARAPRPQMRSRRDPPRDEPEARRKRVQLGPPTQAEIRKVKQLRSEGRSYAEVDKMMGWPDRHGGRSWYIENVPMAYGRGGRGPSPRRAEPRREHGPRGDRWPPRTRR